ncbi:hypothetical protein OCB70_25840 [Bacillus cereus]|nr:MULTISPECIES: hypothetical protein [Bacillus cereus group]MCU5495720.1 hypothetical protein [Bacillus cereus]MCU5550549.1 hypothetical protein [Bacillus cereus]
MKLIESSIFYYVGNVVVRSNEYTTTDWGRVHILTKIYAKQISA